MNLCMYTFVCGCKERGIFRCKKGNTRHEARGEGGHLRVCIFHV